MAEQLDLDPLRATLADADASFLQVQKAVSQWEKADDTLVDRTIGLSSNVQVDRLALYLRRHALLAGVRLKVIFGGYDTLVPDFTTFGQSGVDYILAIPFFDNLRPAFEARLGAGMDAGVVDQVGSDLADQYQFALGSCQNVPQILVAGMHRAWPMAQLIGEDAVIGTLERFRTTLGDVVAGFSNALTVDFQAFAANVGLRGLIDRRFYAQAKAPYSLAMLNEIGRGIAAATRGYGQYYYKVLALDCDNTLWGGVIGEDLLQGIKLSPFDYPGNVFWRVQQEILALQQAGTVLCLCTKNNPADVEEVLTSHPDMPIRPEHLTICKINWDDKSSNLRAIAGELNVGLDSIVFLDDSSYELEGVRSQVPSVRTFQVPPNISEYLQVMEQIKALFVSGGVSAESQAKSQQYKQKLSAESTRTQFASQEEYLASLDLRIEITRNSVADQPRISELTQKSNQFNVTTRRYTPGEIAAAMTSDDRCVYSVVVEDKFGSAGLTAVLVVDFAGDAAEVEAFLMSCRVIGRGVEEAIWSTIAADAAARGRETIRGRYIKTAKNSLVERFYDRLGFQIESEDDVAQTRAYILNVEQLETQKSPWIKVTCVG